MVITMASMATATDAVATKATAFVMATATVEVVKAMVVMVTAMASVAEMATVMALAMVATASTMMADRNGGGHRLQSTKIGFWKK
jgi:hypothetical protein